MSKKEQEYRITVHTAKSVISSTFNLEGVEKFNKWLSNGGKASKFNSTSCFTFLNNDENTHNMVPYHAIDCVIIKRIEEEE